MLLDYGGIPSFEPMNGNNGLNRLFIDILSKIYLKFSHYIVILRKLMTSFEEAVKICKYKLTDKCIKWGGYDDFIGRCCKVCLPAKNEVYYAKHREDLLKRSNSRYIPKEKKSYYVKADYKNGCIYKLSSTKHNSFYIGATCQFKTRLENHKGQAKFLTDRKIYKHFNAIGWDNVQMTLLESYPCANRCELEKREREWIQKLKPDLNIQLVSFDQHPKYCDIERIREMTEIIEKYRKVKPIEILTFSLE